MVDDHISCCTVSFAPFIASNITDDDECTKENIKRKIQLSVMGPLEASRQYREYVEMQLLSTCTFSHLADQDEPGFERLSSTSSSTISASTRRGSVRRNVPSGENSWRRLCPAKDAPPDDDDDDDV